MATLGNLRVKVTKRWFFWPAVLVVFVIGRLGLIRARPSRDYVGGVEPAESRAAKWIADWAMRIEIVPE